MFSFSCVKSAALKQAAIAFIKLSARMICDFLHGIHRAGDAAGRRRAGQCSCLNWWALISRAMMQLRAPLVGLLLLQPVVAFVLDAWLFGRDTEPREWVGLALSLAGIFLAGLKGRS